MFILFTCHFCYSYYTLCMGILSINSVDSYIYSVYSLLYSLQQVFCNKSITQISVIKTLQKFIFQNKIQSYLTVSTDSNQFDAFIKRASLVAQRVKNLPTMWETHVQSLGREDPLEKEMATHSSTLAWKLPWTEKPGRVQSMGSQRVGHD